MNNSIFGVSVFLTFEEFHAAGVDPSADSGTVHNSSDSGLQECLFCKVLMHN